MHGDDAAQGSKLPNCSGSNTYQLAGQDTACRQVLFVKHSCLSVPCLFTHHLRIGLHSAMCHQHAILGACQPTAAQQNQIGAVVPDLACCADSEG